MLRCFTPIAQTGSRAVVHFIFCFASYLSGCYAIALPFLYLSCYMFHPSPPQSTVTNALLMHCLSRHLYSFHLSINTATLDVLRLAFGI
jgi:hypothetical protein